jgi:hypothetical protein
MARFVIVGGVLAVLALGASGGAASARCTYRGQLPDPACTPGASFAGVPAATVCRRGYARSVRNVPYAVKRRVYREYGILRHPRGAYEVDHLIPLELGGSNVIANLWPQPAPGFRVKDGLENALHDLVCSGRLRLGVAQREIARNWVATERSLH